MKNPRNYAKRVLFALALSVGVAVLVPSFDTWA